MTRGARRPLVPGIIARSQAGSALEAGDLSAAQASLKGDWAAADTISRLSVSAAQKTAADTWVTSAPVLAGAGSIGEAKAAYVKSVSALESWCKLTGYDKVVQGL